MDIFKDFREGDWCFSNWRSMWHCLLAGIPEDELFQMLLDGRSMYIMDKPRRVFCSSIVGGILPIACGVALGIKRAGNLEKVYVAVGDMTATTGLYHEFYQYCAGHALPVVIILEDNGVSTNADTRATWGTECKAPPILGYTYKRDMPHVGLHERVSF